MEFRPGSKTRYYVSLSGIIIDSPPLWVSTTHTCQRNGFFRNGIMDVGYIYYFKLVVAGVTRHISINATIGSARNFNIVQLSAIIKAVGKSYKQITGATI